MSRISILCDSRMTLLAAVVCLSSTVQAATPIVYLQPAKGWAIGSSKPRASLLMREISRQAVLTFLREDLGLATRDAWLDDKFDAATMTSLDMVVTPGAPNVIEVLDGVTPQESVLFSEPLPWKVDGVLDYPAFLAHMEALARGSIGTALRRRFAAEAKSPAAPAAGSRELPADIKTALGRMTFESQFVAVRRLHQAIRRQGETPELVGALIRAYMNLGVLTEPYWNPMHQVFKARSLVYAQRWVARDPQSADALRHRAYAWALVGRQASALADLEAAAKLPSQNGRGLSDWSPLIDDFCHYQLSKLGAVSKTDPHYELAQFLRFLATTHTGDQKQILTVVDESGHQLIDCDRVIDGSAEAIRWTLRTPVQIQTDYGNIDFGYTLPELDRLRAFHSDTVGKRLYPRLIDVPGLPSKAVALLRSPQAMGIAANTPEEYELREQLIATLLATPDSDDGGELPWSLLGQIVQELSFFQVLSVTAGGVTNLAAAQPLAPLLVHHHYRAFIGAAGDYYQQNRKLLDELMPQIDLDAIEFTSGGMHSSYLIHPDTGDRPTPAYTAFAMQGSDKLFAHREDLTRNILASMNAYDQKDEGRCGVMLKINPYCPRVVYLVVKHETDKYQSRLADWQRLADDHPNVRAALGLAAADRADPAVRERYLRQAMEETTTPQTVAALANFQYSQGKIDAWRETLDAYLPKVSERMAAEIRVDLAEKLILVRRYKEALPYALAAIDAEFAPGYRAAARASEALQDWENANDYYREWAENGLRAGPAWYFFVRRTGHGSEQTAKDVLNQSIDQWLHPERYELAPYDNAVPGVFYLLENDPIRALPLFREEFQRTHDPFLGLQAALIADGLKQPEQRDELLRTVVKQGKKFKAGTDDDRWRRVQLIELAKLFEKDLKAGGLAQLDRQQLETLRKAARPLDQVVMDYCLGEYCALHGREQDAIEHWKRCMQSTQISSFSRTLAGFRLGERSIPADVYRDALRNAPPSQPK